MKIYDVWYYRKPDMYIYAVLAENGDEALETVRKATGDDTICAFNRGDDDRPTVGEVFELIEQIKQSEKDPHAGIRQQAKNFHRALNNWLECGSFGTGLYTGLKDSEGEGIFEGDDVEVDECGKIRHVKNSTSRRTYYKALPGKYFSLCQIPPEAAESWRRLKDAVK